MNKENFILLRDYLVELAEEKFSMKLFFAVHTDRDGVDVFFSVAGCEGRVKSQRPECTWKACLAGHTQARFAEGGDRTLDAEAFACQWLGIDKHVGAALFNNPLHYGHQFLGAVTKSEVIKQLTDIINAGEVPNEYRHPDDR